MSEMTANYITHSGDDLLVVNAARVSFSKTADFERRCWSCDHAESQATWTDDACPDCGTDNEGSSFGDGLYLSAKDTRLIGYLAKHGHWTPFAHPQITLHLKAPLFVRTQCFKHKVGFTENEISRRYVDDEPEFFVPTEWRARAEDKKQGSGAPLQFEEGRWKDDPGYFVEMHNRETLAVYRRALEVGVAPEQARMVLPQSMMTEWFWTGSLAAWARFVKQRTHEGAQAETRELALLAASHIAPRFPVSWGALTA